MTEIMSKIRDPERCFIWAGVTLACWALVWAYMKTAKK